MWKKLVGYLDCRKTMVAEKTHFFYSLYLLVLESPDNLVRRGKEGCSQSVTQVLLCFVLGILEVLV